MPLYALPEAMLALLPAFGDRFQGRRQGKDPFSIALISCWVIASRISLLLGIFSSHGTALCF